MLSDGFPTVGDESVSVLDREPADVMELVDVSQCFDQVVTTVIEGASAGSRRTAEKYCLGF